MTARAALPLALALPVALGAAAPAPLPAPEQGRFVVLEPVSGEVQARAAGACVTVNLPSENTARETPPPSPRATMSRTAPCWASTVTPTG